MMLQRRTQLVVVLTVAAVVLLHRIHTHRNITHREKAVIVQWSSTSYNGTLSDLLLYKRNQTVRRMVQQSHSSGEMLRLVRHVAENTKHLTEFYPNLSFTGYSFSSVDGKEFDVKQMVSRLLLQHRSSQQPITNVVHHYAISNTGHHYHLPFKGYVSLLSSLWVSGADLVIVWFNRQPGGRYWQLFLRNVTQSGVQDRVMFGSSRIPHSVFGKNLSHVEQKVDVMKLEHQILLGGIFVDNDVVTVRSLQPLRKHSCVIGQDLSQRLCSGTLLTAPANPFMIILYMLYQGYYPQQYDVFGMHLPYMVWHSHQDLCRVEKEKMCKPTWQDEHMRLVYEDLSQLPMHWNWRRNYMVNIWRKTNRDFPEAKLKLETVGSAKSMFGQVAQRILFGSN